MAATNSQLHYRYNFVYVVGVLSMLIVGLVTVHWGRVPDLAALLAFGLTVTSLFLSLIAIIFTIYSSDSFSRSASDILSASKTLNISAAETSEASAELRMLLADIPKHFEQLDHTFTSGHSQLIDKMDTLAGQKAVTPASPPVTAPAIQSSNLSDAVVDLFFRYVSYSAVLCLWTANLARENKVPFFLKDIGPKTDLYLGLLQVMDGVGITDYLLAEETYTVRDLHPRVKAQIEQELKNKSVWLAGQGIVTREHMDAEQARIKQVITSRAAARPKA